MCTSEHAVLGFVKWAALSAGCSGLIFQYQGSSMVLHKFKCQTS